MREAVEKSARHLYGLIHARFINTSRGLAKMVYKNYFFKSLLWDIPKFIIRVYSLFEIFISLRNTRKRISAVAHVFFVIVNLSCQLVFLISLIPSPLNCTVLVVKTFIILNLIDMQVLTVLTMDLLFPTCSFKFIHTCYHLKVTNDTFPGFLDSKFMILPNSIVGKINKGRNNKEELPWLVKEMLIAKFSRSFIELYHETLGRTFIFITQIKDGLGWV